MRCPECELPLFPGIPPTTNAEWRCVNGHAWPLVEGVHRCINADLSRTLDPFLQAFRTYRAVAGERLLEPGMYNRLPESGLDHDPALWQLRTYDLEVITQLCADLSNRLRKRQLRILDVGAWNGWLSHRLAALGHMVTATDVFTDAHDGLGAVRHYPAQFTAVQFDQERLHLFDGPFDLVIAQRCMGFMVDISRSFDQMKSLLPAGGTLFLTGLNVYRDPRSIRGRLAQTALRFTEQYGVPYFFKPVKGYLDLNDQNTLVQSGVELVPYPRLKWKNLISAPFRRKPLYYYGIWHRPMSGG